MWTYFDLLILNITKIKKNKQLNCRFAFGCIITLSICTRGESWIQQVKMNRLNWRLRDKMCIIPSLMGVKFTNLASTILVIAVIHLIVICLVSTATTKNRRMFRARICWRNLSQQLILRKKWRDAILLQTLYFPTMIEEPHIDATSLMWIIGATRHVSRSALYQYLV